MRLVSSIILFASVVSTLAQSPVRPVVPGKTVAEARDGAHHGGGGGGHVHGGGHGPHGGGGHGPHGGGAPVHGGLKGGQSYGPPAKPSYSAPPKQSYGPPKEGNTGYYYYYYPVVPERKKKGGHGGVGGYGGGKSKGMFGKMVETIMYPIMYPIMRMYDYFDGRSFSGRSSSGYVPMELFDKAVKMVEEEIYKEECLSLLICQLGKSAQGYETFVELGSYLLPEEYQQHMKTFKEAALTKNECHKKYICESLNSKKAV